MDWSAYSRLTFDYPSEGVAQYGLYADWLEDLRHVAGRQIVDDMSHGAEAYLQMWERAYGVPAQSCRSPRDSFTSAGLGALRLGDTAERLLRRARKTRGQDEKLPSK